MKRFAFVFALLLIVGVATPSASAYMKPDPCTGLYCSCDTIPDPFKC